MMGFWEIIILVIIPSGIVGALAGGLVNHFSNKSLDIYRRTMEARKDVYTKVNEILSKFISTVNKEESNNYREKLLKYFREIQIWGSDEVVQNFNDLLNAMDAENNISEEKRNYTYKNFIISMRKDILGKTNLLSEDIIIRGIVPDRDGSVGQPKTP